MNKQQLAAKIWEACNNMRSKIDANDYKDYVLGFIFYKFLSEAEVKFCKENDFEDADIRALSEEDVETVDYIRDNLGYFIAFDNMFSTWIKEDYTDPKRKFSVDDVRTSISAFNRSITPAHKKVFEKIFNTLETGLSKLGENAATQTKAIRDLIDVINIIPMDGQDYDTIGFIYEYLISNFASSAGKKAGEFYTPHEVSMLISEIAAEHCKDKTELSIYDPTSGSGSLLLNLGQAVSKRVGSADGIKYYAQELKENTYNLTRMNLVMRGILPSNITTRCGDTLEEDWPYFDESDPAATYNPLYVDIVASNPPYSQRWDSTDKETEPRYAYGLAPTSKADYAFLLHDLYHLRPDGIMCIVLPHGVLFRGGEEGQIRKNLLENRHIQAIIGLPANIFYGTGIPTIIMVLRQKRTESDVLFIDASKGFEKAGKQNVLRACDIKRIADTVASNESVEKYSRLVSLEEIRANDYNLNIPRYVDSSEEAETWDVYASMFGGIPVAEIDKLSRFWNAWPSLREQLFVGEGNYVSPASANLREIINANEEVKAYCTQFEEALKPFSAWLETSLVDDWQQLDAPRMQQMVSAKLFETLEETALVDPYVAYQFLDAIWSKCIEGDLELLQSEGIAAARQVDPNMVSKKVKGKDTEVQDGWVGHIVPFELAQKALLPDVLEQVQALENTLSECSSSIEQSVEELSEDEKELFSDALNDENTEWKAAEVKKMLKVLRLQAKTDTTLDEPVAKLQMVQYLFESQKKLKASIKSAQADLIDKTKDAIENLTDEQIRQLLIDKWITPFESDLKSMPGSLIEELATSLGKLEKKYETTLADVSTQISEAEKELAAMIDELTGNEFDMAGLRELKKLLGGE